MNTDPSNNIINRRMNGGGGGVDDPERNSPTYRERFDLNQYYNAVEDEQIYMDEYTTLSHRYNEFLMNANGMYMRMEQTLRESLTRTMVRQSFYYQRVQENAAAAAAAGGRGGLGLQQPIAAPALAPALSGYPSIPSAPAVAAATRLGDVFPRLLSRYFTTELNREAREANTDRGGGGDSVGADVAMLYTVPIHHGLAGAVGAGSGIPRPGAPTNDQINRATLNTVFSNIVSPINTTCPISRDEFNDDSEITMIRGCNHVFNRVSLREWFIRHSTCPMCRRDIRTYNSSSSSSSSSSLSLDQTREREHVVVPQATNISIDRVDDDSITFSYDLPIEYTNEQIYQDIVNRVAGRMPQTSQYAHPHHHNENDNDNDDDDITAVDVD